MGCLSKYVLLGLLLLFITKAIVAEDEAAPAEDEASPEKEDSGDAEDGGDAAAEGEGNTITAPADGVFDIKALGAKGDGKTDDAKILVEIWDSACAVTGQPKIVIPEGEYLVGPVTFKGPCKSPITMEVQGTIIATEDLESYGNSWFLFMHVDDLTLTGGGTLNGKGATAWPHNECTKKWECKVLPNGLVFAFCNNVHASNINSIDAKMFHILIFESKNITVDNFKITAPEDSPNTDGIHLGQCSDIKILNTVIGSGDDCISVGPTVSNLEISGVTCGPGHGISVGSLGKREGEKDVIGLKVTNCTLDGTDNGLRIKTWQSSASALKCDDFTYENIVLKDVKNPIIIDQEYCPYPSCKGKEPSLVAISNVKFKNVKGTSRSNEAIKLICSETHPCQGVELDDISFDYVGEKDNKTMWFNCSNAKGSASNILNVESSCF